MKKLLFLIPFILFSCLDSELEIPGENIGDPGVEVDPPTEFPILKEYNSAYPGFEYALMFNKDRFLYNYNTHIINRDENGRITSVNKAGKEYIFNYNNDKLLSIVQGASTYTLEYIKKDDDLVHLSAATQKINNSEVAQYEFSTNKLKFINQYKVQFLDRNKVPIEGKYALAKFNIKIIQNKLSVKSTFFERNNSAVSSITLTENEDPNPVSKLTRTDFNPLVLVEAFSEEIDATNTPQLDLLALLIADYNRVEVTHNSETFMLKYNKRDDNYPNHADVKKTEDGENVGEVIYTYR